MAQNTSHRKSQTIPSASTDGRTAACRASDALPLKPYVYSGGENEPAAVTAARERHQAINAEIERRSAALAAERSGADCVGPGTGWDPLAARELTLDTP